MVSPTLPVTPKPTDDSSGTVGCCSLDFKNCFYDEGHICDKSESNCEVQCSGYWLADGAIDGCKKRLDACASDAECCSPSICQEGEVSALVSLPSLGIESILEQFLIRVLTLLRVLIIFATNNVRNTVGKMMHRWRPRLPQTIQVAAVCNYTQVASLGAATPNKAVQIVDNCGYQHPTRIV